MTKVLISRLMNGKTSVIVGSFPIEYFPVFYTFRGISTSMSGVGYNVAKALKAFCDEVKLFSIIGDDSNGSLIKMASGRDDIDPPNIIVLEKEEVAKIVFLADKVGQGEVHYSLKGLQDVTTANPLIDGDIDLAILTNINFSHSLIVECERRGIIISSDINLLTDIEDEYKRSLAENANTHFLYNKDCLGKEKGFIKRIYIRFHNRIIVTGCGADGAFCYDGKKGRMLFRKGHRFLGDRQYGRGKRCSMFGLPPYVCKSA